MRRRLCHRHPWLDLRGQQRLGPTKHPVERPPRAWFRWILDRGHDPAVTDHRLFRPDRKQSLPRRNRQRRAMPHRQTEVGVLRGPIGTVTTAAGATGFFEFAAQLISEHGPWFTGTGRSRMAGYCPMALTDRAWCCQRTCRTWPCCVQPRRNRARGSRATGRRCALDDDEPA